MRPSGKLKHDALVEALVDIRFETPQSIPEELVIGRLADREQWSSWNMRRLPTSEIPSAIRQVEAGLKYQATVELTDPENRAAVKIGANILSIHLLAPYPGWSEFKSRIEEALTDLFKRLPGVRIVRLGLRYVNAFEAERHGIIGVEDLDLQVLLAGEDLGPSINLNFRKDRSENHAIMTKVASVDFVHGKLSKSATVIADIDVFTPREYSESNHSSVMKWIEQAHDFEKDSFFALLTDSQIKELSE